MTLEIDPETIEDETPDIGDVGDNASVSSSDFDETTDEHVENNTTVVIVPPAPDPAPEPTLEPEGEDEWRRELRETEARITRRIDDLCDEVLDMNAVSGTGDEGETPPVAEVPAEPEVPASQVETRTTKRRVTRRAPWQR